MSVNKVILMGRLGQEPELKYTPSGTPIATLSLATSKKWTDKNGQQQEKTEWHRVVLWNKLAELANQYLAKGRQVYIEGELQTRQWESKSGEKHYTTEVLGQSMQFIGNNPNSGDQQGKTSNQQSQGNSVGHDTSYSYGADFSADDIPF